jgi:hypothetical protein
MVTESMRGANMSSGNGGGGPTGIDITRVEEQTCMAFGNNPMSRSVSKEQIDGAQTLQASRGLRYQMELGLSRGKETDGGKDK